MEPDIELPNTRESSPDVAGWCCGGMPELPIDDPIRVAPGDPVDACPRLEVRPWQACSTNRDRLPFQRPLPLPLPLPLALRRPLPAARCRFGDCCQCRCRDRCRCRCQCQLVVGELWRLG
jgi:hypothetical protein